MTEAVQKAEEAANTEQSAENNENGHAGVTRARAEADNEYERAGAALRTVANALDLSDVAVKTAESIYRNAIGEGVHEGRRLERIGVASVPLAARVHAKPIALGRVTEVVSEEVEAANIEKRGQLSSVMKIVSEATETNIPPTTAEEFIASVVEGVESDAEGDDGLSGFSNPGTVITEARAILASASGAQAERGNSPPGVAAGAVFRIAEDRGESVTGAQVGEAAGVSRPTVYKHARSFLDTET